MEALGVKEKIQAEGADSFKSNEFRSSAAILCDRTTELSRTKKSHGCLSSTFSG